MRNEGRMRYLKKSMVGGVGVCEVLVRVESSVGVNTR